MPASPDDFASGLRAIVAAAGAIPVARFMALANTQYYATRDPLGATGDFTTAPEISQMFGELIGLWCADLAARAGHGDAAWVELGPGRGTLAADATRAMARAGFAPAVHLVETSPVLRARQAARIPGATWHDAVASLPTKRPLIVVANEFFDALPIAQYVATPTGWRERMVVAHGADLAFAATGPAPAAAAPPRAAPGKVYERGVAAAAIMADLARRIARQGGAILAIDYGYEGPAIGDTLQAVRAHAFVDPLGVPGAVDLTAHVDFAALAKAARDAGARVTATTQGRFLTALGLAPRAQALARAAPDRADEIADAHRRLASPGAMGRLFRVLAATAPGWPTPAGFD